MGKNKELGFMVENWYDLTETEGRKNSRIKWNPGNPGERFKELYDILGTVGPKKKNEGLRAGMRNTKEDKLITDRTKDFNVSKW